MITFLKSRQHVRLFLSSLACLLAGLGAQAHDPFDISSRLMVYENRMELTSTLGADGMRQFLSGAGFSPEEIANHLKARGPEGLADHPTSLALRFFRLKNEGGLLLAKRVTSLSEGMEIIVTLTYPRPAAGPLEIQAVCYETIPGLQKGILIVEDESTGSLGAALLSPAKIHLTVSLPASSQETKITTSAPEWDAEANSSRPASAPAATISAPPANPSFGEFFKLGVEHILIGFDHLLFLAALLIGIQKPMRMLGVITCFTLAHSATLALAAMNLVTISPRIVEPLIAASIIVVCVANLVRQQAETDRLWLAGVFGLIHGFGFAAALRETGLGHAGASIALPLFSFNLGVEAGQLAVAAVFLPLLILVRRWPRFGRYGAPAISSGVILISGYWLAERTFF